jgi:hypothetical protein
MIFSFDTKPQTALAQHPTALRGSTIRLFCDNTMYHLLI